jgi:hypothetical protein
MKRPLFRWNVFLHEGYCYTPTSNVKGALEVSLNASCKPVSLYLFNLEKSRASLSCCRDDRIAADISLDCSLLIELTI